MNFFTRGIRNAFRNGIRTIAIVIILGISIGLSLTMLVAHKAVENKITSVKASIGNTISVSAAGVMGFEGGGNPLSESSVNKLSTLSHVSSVSETVSDQLRNTSSTSRDGTTDAANTSLQSAISAGSLGQRFGGGGGGGGSSFAGGGSTTGFTFTPPVSAYGSTDTSTLNGATLTIKSGTTINGTVDKDVALIGTTLASKNNLKVGSTFTAYNDTITVAGIFDTGTTFSNNAVIFSLPTLQRLSSQAGDLTSAVVTVDSISNINSVTTAVKSSLGSTADVTSSEDTANNAITPLNSVKTISLFSLVGSVIAGAIIILLVMIMVVRERKREIGVIKAIGGSNLRIMAEFMVESLTLTILGAFIGLLIGVIGGQPVTKLLVTDNTTTTSTTTSGGFARGNFGGGGAAGSTRPSGFGGGFRQRVSNNAGVKSLDNIKTQIGWGILLDGFGAAVVIAVVGSALAAGMIAKVRPSEVLRSA